MHLSDSFSYILQGLLELCDPTILVEQNIFLVYANEMQVLLRAILVFKFVSRFIVLDFSPIDNLSEMLRTVDFYENWYIAHTHSEIKS